MAFKKVKGNGKNSAGALVVLLIVVAVFIYFLGNALNSYNYGRSVLTQKDTLLCAQNEIFDTAQCLKWLLDNDKKDTSEALRGADETFKNLANLLLEGG